MTPTLTEQYFDVAVVFGRVTATDALAEWLRRDDRPRLDTTNAVVGSPLRMKAGQLTREHLGRRISFSRAGATTAAARVAGHLSAIRAVTRASGMPGIEMTLGGVPYGPLAPHLEVIIVEQYQTPAQSTGRSPRRTRRAA